MPKLKISADDKAHFKRIEQFKGINVSAPQAQIGDNDSPDLLNVIASATGGLNKRTGYELLSSHAEPIYTIFEFSESEILIVHGTKITKRIGTSETAIYTSLNDNPNILIFNFNGKCYIADGVNYLTYDGATISPVVPYVPMLAIADNPQNEDFNLLGTKFKQSFSGDSSNRVFQLSLKELDVAPVTASIDGVNFDKVETTHFTVDRTNGKITFISAPPTGTNNVIIQASKLVPGFADRIKKCTTSILFGGANDSRVFVTGNKDSPNTQWRSGLNDPTYFPENGNYIIGADSEKLSGFVKQYDSKIDLKTESLWHMRYEFNSEGSTFPTKPINDKVGAYAPKSIQLCDNKPIFLSKQGVYELTQSTIRDESNVKHISAKVDRLLLEEVNLKDAISVDFDRKYWLAVNNRVYVYDYTLKEWYIFDNISANCFLEHNGLLYFGSKEGKLYRFKKENHQSPYNDNGLPIQSYWKSKQFSFDADEFLKVVEEIYLTLRPYASMSVVISYETDKKAGTIQKKLRMDTFDFRTLDFSKLSFIHSTFPREVMAKIKTKKITHFQLVLTNNELDENLGVLSATIKYRYGSKVR